MDVGEFWSTVEIAKPDSSADYDIGTHENTFKEVLSKLSTQDLIEFQLHFNEQRNRAFTWELWRAAYLIGGGCSDDGFDYFITGLIVQGKDIFEQAITNADSLADLSHSDQLQEGELFGYVTIELFEERDGQDADFFGALDKVRKIDTITDPSGDGWEEDNLESHKAALPKLYAKFSSNLQ